MVAADPSLLDLMIALIPAAIAASNPVVVLALGTATMLFGVPSF
ncbi:hypothetical protein [Paracoccus lutimaris]|uniref:Uncharacterized protein n=1 Tax=Paracoccus lutimaris TaxID=1490030 RepID=A0A368YJP2_9RHOB|nr:hypothetical protein [Paracoccus lutimaris]RCW80462.1 hypothetical protein DFP89_11921 [Paracoccus lutimaris]